MIAKISDLAARIIIKQWYEIGNDFAAEYVAKCVDTHFPLKDGDIFDCDFFTLIAKSDGWYVSDTHAI